MRNAVSSLVTMAGLALLAGCGSNGDQQDNRANAIEANSSVVEVDTLPPDESSETSTNDLVSGDVTPEGDGNLTPPANEQ